MSHLSPATLSLYLDEELDAAARAGAEAHLASCPQCRHELAALRELFAAFAAMPAEPLLIDLAPLVLAQLAPAPPLRWPARAWLLLAAQLSVALALGSWLLPMFVERLAGLRLIAEPLDLAAAWSMTAERWSTIASSLAAGWQALALFEPLAAIAPGQWASALGLAALIWLIANRLFLAGLRDPGEPLREVR